MTDWETRAQERTGEDGVVTLTEFLLARIAAEQQREREGRWESWAADLPSGVQDDARVAWEKSMKTQELDAVHALRRFGWAVMVALWPQGGRSKAAQYADHPDYDEAWLP